MFISAIDEGLDRLFRAELKMPAEVGDVTFEAPTSNWSAQLSRITVSLFLYEVSRSRQPARGLTRRTSGDGRAKVRPPQPVVDLGYLASAWAGSSRDEHQLLGDMVGILTGLDTIPDEYLTQPLGSSVHLAFDSDESNRTREIWTALGGQLKASCLFRVSVVADTYAWRDQAPLVDRIDVRTVARDSSWKGMETRSPA